MALTTAQKQFIVHWDIKAKSILQYRGEEALLISLSHQMDQIKEIMDSSSSQEFNGYCAEYGNMKVFISP